MSSPHDHAPVAITHVPPSGPLAETLGLADHGAFAVLGADDAGAPTLLGEVTYTVNAGVLTLWHTGVRDALRGQGVAGKLVDAAVAHAEAAGLKVQPLCSYAARRFDKTPAWAALRA